MARIDFIAAQLGYERNLLEVYRRATADNIADGLAWYPTAQQKIVETANGVFPLEVAAAITAMLSPRITWQSNIEGLRRIAKRVSEFSQMVPTVAGVRANVRKAWETAQDGNVFRVSGPKVSAFYQNLLGNLERVTVDVWAARAAGVTENLDHLDGNRYKALERAYQSLAKELGFKPAELQAICWIVVRGKGE